jgi:hypothetical protein
MHSEDREQFLKKSSGRSGELVLQLFRIEMFFNLADKVSTTSASESRGILTTNPQTKECCSAREVGGWRFQAVIVHIRERSIRFAQR